MDNIWAYILANSIWTEIGIAIGIFFVFILLRKLFVQYVFNLILKFAHKTKTSLDEKILLAFKKPLQFLFIIVGFYFALIYLTLTPAQDFLLSRLFRSFMLIFLAAGFYNLADGESALFDEAKEKFGVEIDRILIPFLSTIMRFAIIVLIITIIAGEWGFDVNAFITGLGLGGLAFALAAKDTIGNIFGGIIIITDKPFSIGDWIYTPSVEGTVEDISFRSTRVRTFAQALVTVPNSTLANQPITNWTRMGKRRITFTLGVTYTTPRDKLVKCLENIRDMLKNHPAIHQKTIFVRFDQFSESSLDIFLYFFTHTTNWDEYLEVREDVNLKIMEILENEGVSAAFPSRSIYFENSLDAQPALPEKTH